MQAKDLQAELHSTQEALKPVKTSLLFSLPGFDLNTQKPVLSATLPAVNNIVHVDFGVINATDVPAEQGAIMVTICATCKFAKEPSGFVRPARAPETQRNREFPILNVQMAFQDSSVDILIPTGTERFDIAFQYRCRNCIVDTPQIAHITVSPN